MMDFFEDLDRLEGMGRTDSPLVSSAEHHLRVLADLGRDMSAALDLDDLVRIILLRLVEITGAHKGLLFLAGEGGEHRVFKGVDRFGENLPPSELVGRRPAVAEVFGTGATVVREMSAPADGDSVAILAVPLESGRGRFGVLDVERPLAKGAFDAEARLLAMLVATQAAQAIELFRLEEERRRSDRVRLENEFLRRLSRRQEEQARIVETLNHQLKRRSLELMETSTFLQGILDSSTEYAIIAVDPEGTITAFNSGASSIYGWSAEEVAGKASVTILFTPEDKQRLRRMMDEAAGASGRFAAETIRVRKGGEEVPVRVAMTAIRNPRGEVQGYLDISSNVAAERELRRQLLLSEKMAALGTLSAGVAHEFNNILQGIIGFLGHALTKEDPVLWKRAMTVSLDAANRASKITSRLQAFARPNVSGLAPVSVRDLVEDTLALVERSFASDGVETRREIPEGLPCILADRSRLSQVLLNLLTNARHAVAREERRIVTISASVEGEWILLRVADTGCGIPEEAQSRIFEPFYTTKGALGGRIYDGKVHGTGLGLAISSGIITEHGGRIEVASKPGEGTVITLRLRRAAEDARAASESGTEGDENDGGPVRRLSVLVADDEDFVRELLVEVLGERGHLVTHAGDGEEALERFRSGRFDVVVADYQMPGLDGVTLLERITAESAGTPPRRILVTGRSQGSCRDLPCLDAWLHKPFTIERIVTVVEGEADGD